MTIQDQRVAAAEIEGWTDIQPEEYAEMGFDPHSGAYEGPMRIVLTGRQPDMIGACACEIPDYLNSTDAAIRLVEVLEKEGWWFDISKKPNGPWTCAFSKPNGAHPFIHFSECPTAPLAITQAALRAKGRWVQEGDNE
jgi:Phage ABA sandwich domain